MNTAQAQIEAGQRNIAEFNLHSLTGLPGRQRFLTSLEAKVHDQAGGFSVHILDVDGLKDKNDAEGHASGNDLILSIANTVMETAKTGKLYHLHGDEFALIADETDDDEVKTVTKTLEEALEANGTPASIAGRAHVAGETDIELLHDVDLSMFERKAERKAAKYAKELSALPLRQRIQHIAGRKLLNRSGLIPPNR
ncbi:MAG: diguanylate cyclase [Patescibacteria group bacterium]